MKICEIKGLELNKSLVYVESYVQIKKICVQWYFLIKYNIFKMLSFIFFRLLMSIPVCC